jgi:endonuclease YncB( thermonuclease family)
MSMSKFRALNHYDSCTGGETSDLSIIKSINLKFGIKIAFSILLGLLLPSLLWAWTGEVVKIADGDTITVLKGNTTVKIRLYGIDCPERGQAFGQKAKQFTASMVFRRYVKIEPVDTDRYGRTVAWVYVNGKNLCEELVGVATKIDGNMMKNGQEQRGKRDGAPSRSLAGS